MAEAYPRSPRSAFLNWCEAHIDPWDSNSSALGLGTVIADYKSAVSDAIAAEGEAVAARSAAKAATEKANQAVRALQQSASDCVRRIKQKAIDTGNPDLYVIGQVPAPSAPGTALPPAKPTDISVSISPTGAPVLKWRAANPAGTSGTSYIIRRKVAGQNEFTFCGVSGKKTFTDNTFTAGPDSVQYTVQGQRADSAGLMSDVFTVTFGRTGTGGAGGGNANFAFPPLPGNGNNAAAA